MVSSANQPEPSAAPASACRTCGGLIGADSQFAPFCSDRCRMADLNRWFSGEYKVSRELKPDDLDELES